MDLRPGERAGRYTLVEPLGEGAQGSVWKIIDPEQGVVLALKLLDVARLPPSATERARLEVDAVNRAADHPAIVPCRDLFSLPDGRLGLVFDLVRGRELLEVAGDPRMTADHRQAVLEQLASALAHVHQRGIVHRDLKPDNVLVTDAFWSAPRAAGSVKLVDFGIASIVASPRGLTAVGGFVGTVPYVAPEVLWPRRWPVTREGFARDVFAFGVLGWELIAGAHPTGLPLDAPVEAYASAYETAADAHMPWPPSGPAGSLSEVLAACLTLDPTARPADGAAIERALAGRRARRRAGMTRPHETPTQVPDTNAAPNRAIPPTSVHAPQTRGYAVPLTTPMPGPPSGAGWSPRSSPASSFGPSVMSGGPPAAPARASRVPWLVAAVLGVVGFAGIVALVMGDSQPVSSARVTPPRASSPDPPSQPPASCCSEGRTCTSGRLCSPCTPTRLPERWWRLRLTGAARGKYPAFSEDLTGAYPRGSVFVRRKEAGQEWLQAPFVRVAKDGGDRDDRLHVHTSDLEEGRVEISLTDGSAKLVTDASAPNSGGLKTTVLCYGVRLYLGPRDAASFYIHGYLDEDD